MEHALALRVLSNERLAALASRGDGGAFEVLYERHRGALYRYCHGILRHHDDAQDAVQATMTRALTGLGARDPGASWNAWLFRIARNESIDQLRRRRSFEPLVESHAARDASPHARAEHRERLGAVLRDLGELPGRQRDALVMRALGGVAPAEIGAALSLSPAAARQAVFEARESLQDFAAGRELPCSAVRQTIAGGDARRLRARPLRAHLRSCATCRSYRAEQRTGVRGRLAALVPLSWWLPGWGSGAGETATSLAGGSVAAKALLAVLATTLTVGVAHRGLVPFGEPAATGPTPHPAHSTRPGADVPRAFSPSVAPRSAAPGAPRPATPSVRTGDAPPPTRRTAARGHAPAGAPPMRGHGHAPATPRVPASPAPSQALAPFPAPAPAPPPLGAPEHATAPAAADLPAPAPPTGSEQTAGPASPTTTAPTTAPAPAPATPPARSPKPAARPPHAAPAADAPAPPSPAPADQPPAPVGEAAPAATNARPNGKVPPGQAAKPDPKAPPGKAKRGLAADSA